MSFPKWAPPEAVEFFVMELERGEAPANASESRRLGAYCSTIARTMLTDDRAKRIWEKLDKHAIPLELFLSFISGFGAWVSVPSTSRPGGAWSVLTQEERRKSCARTARLVAALRRSIAGTPIAWCEENGGAQNAVRQLDLIESSARRFAEDEQPFGRNDESAGQRELAIRLALFFQKHSGKRLAPVVCDCIELVFGGARIDETRIHSLLRDFKTRNSVEAMLLLNSHVATQQGRKK